MKTPMEVRKERTGWRDNTLDQLLEENGIPQFNSFLVTEYNYGCSVAMIEYKRVGCCSEADERLVHYCRMRKNQEFYFVVLYDYELIDSKCRITKFIVYARNDMAIKEYGADPLEMKELQFIDFLYEIRRNVTSRYREKAHQDYCEWFDLKVSFDVDKQVISNRHRSYAYDVPAADIDSIVCDEDNKPYLFIEYKENNNYGRMKNNGHNDFIFNNVSQKTLCLIEEKSRALNNKAIADLGDGCKEPLPVLIVEYNLEHNVFRLYAFNNCAKEIAQLGTMTKEEYLKYINEPKNFKKCMEMKENRNTHICPKCGNKMEIRNGVYGKFYGCRGFKSNNCRYTEKYKEVV